MLCLPECRATGPLYNLLKLPTCVALSVGETMWFQTYVCWSPVGLRVLGFVWIFPRVLLSCLVCVCLVLPHASAYFLEVKWLCWASFTFHALISTPLQFCNMSQVLSSSNSSALNPFLVIQYKDACDQLLAKAREIAELSAATAHDWAREYDGLLMCHNYFCLLLWSKCSCRQITTKPVTLFWMIQTSQWM